MEESTGGMEPPGAERLKQREIEARTRMWDALTRVFGKLEKLGVVLLSTLEAEMAEAEERAERLRERRGPASE